MALTGMQIYKNLPKTNCKDCGFPTCMAFAMQVAAKQRELTACPHLSEDSKTSLSEASAPPMRLISIGKGAKEFKIGQETVMYRHEEKFHRACGVAVRIPAALSREEALALVDYLNSLVFTRVGRDLKPSLYAVEVDGCPDLRERVTAIAARSRAPLILSGRDTAALKTAAMALKEERPLLYKADASSLDQLIPVAKENNLPLAVSAPGPEKLAELTEKAKKAGLTDLLLDFESPDPDDVLCSLTRSRRAALKKGFRTLGFPAVVNVRGATPQEEGILAATFAAKYAGIVIVTGSEPWELLTILTAIQDIYTDPQVPNMVEAKLYEIGSPDVNSPVLFTTNFSLTYFSVAGEVERSKVPAYISVVDTEGLGVLNAYAGDKISVEKVLKTLAAQEVAGKVSHRKLIIPGYLPIFRAEIEETSEWKEVIIGPENAKEIPAFLNANWK